MSCVQAKFARQIQPIEFQNHLLTHGLTRTSQHKQLLLRMEAHEGEAPPSPLSLPSLPNPTDLTRQHIGFLDQHLRTHEGLLHNSTQLSSSLAHQCSQLDSQLRKLQSHLTKRTVLWIPRSFEAKSSLDHLTLTLQNLSLRTSPRPLNK